MVKVKKKVLLVILDGFGLRESEDYNAIKQAKMPNWERLTKDYAFGSIDASAKSVGLPTGQFGNSEVGHLNIGAGRIVQQDITKIDTDIEDGIFDENQVLINCFNKTTTHTVHIMGLLSDGGVHAHINHIIELIKFANAYRNIQKIWIHLFLDGRDTPPQSAEKYLKQLNEVLKEYHRAEVATVSGRFYAMDRDKRYERIELAYKAIVQGNSLLVGRDTLKVLEQEYQFGNNDEFVRPYVMNDYTGMHDGDSVVFANFRSDRAIQLTDAIITPDFNGFVRNKIVNLASYVTMTQYDTRFNVDVAYPPFKIENTLGEYIANLGLKQLRIAETEKYPHVTFFFNGGRKEPYANEDRILVDSPRDVATYDLKPEMSLPEVSHKLVTAIKEDKYDFIITNFANCDMVGHSGDLSATIKAVEAIDLALGNVVDAMLSIGGEVLVIADHGNCEEMFDYVANQPHTQHTTNLVPFLYIGRLATIKSGGALKDVSPSLLAMAGIEQPSDMLGECLIKFKE